MARQIDSEITGTIGNIIFYESQGEFFMRTVQRQAPASIKAAKDFGKASSLAKILRQLLAPIIPDPKDKEMQNRLCTAMRKFLASPENNTLAGFRFIESSGLRECIRFPLGITELTGGKIQFEIPAINPVHSINAPAGTSRVQVMFLAVGLNTDNKPSWTGSPEVLNIPYTDALQPALRVVMETRPKAGSIVLVGAALSYWNPDRQIIKQGFTPAEIVAVFKK